MSLQKKLKALGNAPPAPGGLFMASIGGATLLAVIASAFVIWNYGPINGFGQWLAWRSDTPQYAVRRIIEATQTGDLAKLDSYVDMANILAQFATVGGPTRAELLKSLEAQRNTAPKNALQYKEWRVGAMNGDNKEEGGEDLSRLQLSEKDGHFTTVIYPRSDVTGQFCRVVFTMEPIDGRYRITRADTDDIQEFIKNNNKNAERLPSLIKEATAKAKPLVDMHLTSLRGQEQNLQWQCDVVNKGKSPIRLLECAVVLKRADTGTVAIVETVYLDCNDLPPGGKKTVEASSEVSAVVAQNVASGRLVVLAAIPIAVVYADERVDLVELPRY